MENQTETLQMLELDTLHSGLCYASVHGMLFFLP